MELQTIIDPTGPTAMNIESDSVVNVNGHITGDNRKRKRDAIRSSSSNGHLKESSSDANSFDGAIW